MNEQLPPKLEVQEITARLVQACRRYTELTGKFLYVDIYPIDPHFGGTDDYTYELFETGFKEARDDV